MYCIAFFFFPDAGLSPGQLPQPSHVQADGSALPRRLLPAKVLGGSMGGHQSTRPVQRNGGQLSEDHSRGQSERNLAPFKQRTVTAV